MMNRPTFAPEWVGHNSVWRGDSAHCAGWCYMPDITTIWSSGGGVQSTALAALIVTRRLPAPDRAVIVDTTRERSSTWDYLRQWTIPALYRAGIEMIRIQADEYADTSIYEAEDSDRPRLLIPAYTAGTSVTGGKLLNHCSTRWKRRVAQRWARAQGIQRAEVLYGISTDELRRVRVSREQWWQHRYPLIDLRLSRADCYAVVRDIGWPPPPKSSCWCCPHMRAEEWRDLRDHYPDDFHSAVALEREIQRHEPHIYLTRDLSPLDRQTFVTTTLPLDLGGCDSQECGY